MSRRIGQREPDLAPARGRVEAARERRPDRVERKPGSWHHASSVDAVEGRLAREYPVVDQLDADRTGRRHA
jgi:hypothetical protein